MIRTILFYGVIGALVTGAFMVTGSLGWAGKGGQPPEGGVYVGYLTQIVALTTVFLGIKAHRDNALGGVIKFLPALGVGLAISFIASLGWVIAWEIVLKMSGLDFPALMNQQMVAQAQARHATDAELRKIAADAASFAKMYANPLVRMPMTFVEMFPTGVLISLISAALLRNSRFMPSRKAA